MDLQSSRVATRSNITPASSCDASRCDIQMRLRDSNTTRGPLKMNRPTVNTFGRQEACEMLRSSEQSVASDSQAPPGNSSAPEKRDLTTTPNRIRKWSPTLLLTGRYPGCLRRSDGMRNFVDSMVVDDFQSDLRVHDRIVQ